MPNKNYIYISSILGPMADKLGRKDTLVYNIVPEAFGWIIICYAESVPVLLFGRLMNGIAIGVICCVAPMYCVEIATVEVRGILGSACQGFLVIGNLISVVIGAYMSWNYLALNGAVCSILAVIFFCPMPESPRWLLMKNRLPDAIKVMNDLQGGYVNAEKECAAIYKDLQNQPKGGVTWQELKRRSSIIPAVLCLFVMFFQHFSGMNAVFLYSSSVFEVSKDFINPKVATVILAVVQVVATLLSNVTVDKAGRKILLILSGGLMGISFAIFGFYYYKISHDKTFETGHGWIPLACCITAVIGYSVGYGPIPFFLTAEIVPVRVRSTINAVTHFANGMFGFIVTNTFSDVENVLKNYGAFWFYSSMSALGIIFVIIFLPETKGKTIDEIQDIFEKKRKKTRQQINIAVMP